MSPPFECGPDCVLHQFLATTAHQTVRANNGWSGDQNPCVLAPLQCHLPTSSRPAKIFPERGQPCPRVLIDTRAIRGQGCPRSLVCVFALNVFRKEFGWTPMWPQSSHPAPSRAPVFFPPTGSTGGAVECSPRREPWDLGHKSQAPEGRQQTSSSCSGGPPGLP